MKKLFGRQQTSEPPVSFRANATQLERINRYLEEQSSEEPALVVTVSPRGTTSTTIASNTTTVTGTGAVDGSNTGTPNGFAHLEESGENVGETSSDVAVRSAVGDVERDEQHHQHHNPSPADDGEVFDSADKEHNPVVGKKNIHNNNNNKDISTNNSKISTTSQECEAMNSDSPSPISTDNQQVVPLHGTTPSPSIITSSPTTYTNTSINSPQLLSLSHPSSSSSSSSSPSSSPTTSSGSSPTLHHQPKPLPKRPPVSMTANNSNNGTIPTSTKTLPVPVKAMPVPPAKTAATINHYSNNNNNNHKVTPVPTTATTATTTTPSTSSSSTTSVAEKLFSTSPSSTSSSSSSNNNNNNKGSPSTTSSEQNMLAAAMEANQQQKVLELTQEIDKIPQFIRDAISDVEQRGLRSEGIFRLGSPKNKMDDAWQLILETPPQNLHELRIDFVQRGDVNLTANILKKYFRELREPLIPFDLYHAFLNAGKTSNTAIPVTPTAIVDQKKELSEKEQLIVKELKAACDQLPPVRRKVLSMLCELWWKVACNQPTNRMTPYNISVVVQPNILYSRTRTPMEVMANMKHEQRVVSDFVIYYELLLKDESNSNSTSDSNSQSPTEANAGSIGTDGGTGGDKTPPSTEPTSSSNSSPSSQSPSKGTDNNSSNSGDGDKKKEEEVAQAIVSEQQLLMEVQKRRNILHNVTEKTFSGRGVYTGTVNSSGMMQGVGTLRLLNGSVYTGEFVLSQYHGSGELTEANGAKFVGKWYCGKRLGKGVMTYADKSKYEGDWMEDQRSGTGAMVYADDSVYEGGWHQDKYDGDGAFRSDDVKYIGRWSNGLYHGSGALEDYVKKQIYKGEFANGLYHGKGRLRSINPQSGKCKFKGQFQEGKPYSGKGSIAVDMNTTLTGKWIDGKLEGTALIMYDKDDDARAGYKGQVDSELKPHGKGIMRYKDDTEYAGQWEHGMKCGEGTLLMSSDNLTYEGQFQNDQFHGHGKLIDASHRVVFEGDFNQGIPRSGSGSIKLNGNTYNGTFYDGNFFGRGTIRNPSDGSIYEGSLEDGLYHGQGKLTYSDGSTFKGRFVSNCKVEGVFRDECGREYSVEYSLEGIEKKRERLHRELSIDDRREMAQHNTGVIVNSWTEILQLKQQQQQQPEQPTIEIDHKLLGQFQASIQHLMSDDRSVPHLQPVLEMMTQMSLFLKKQSSTTEEQ